MLAAYGIPQSRLAATIGLSAPMLSQLATAQRAKISNPAVYARLVRLEELAGSPAVRSGDAEGIRATLDEVAASQPQMTSGAHVTGDTPAVAVGVLASVATGAELEAAAAAVPGTRLAAVLRDAARTAGR